MLAGSETTTNLIGNAVLALFDHPAELAKVRAQLSLMTNVIEETLRYDAPVQSMPRQTLCDVALAGTTIPAGAVIIPLFGSANRDEQKFADPDRFDVMREPEGHLGFGYGIHYCLGAPLARLETKAALEALFCRPGLVRKSQPVERVDGIIIRGPMRLPLAFQ